MTAAVSASRDLGSAINVLSASPWAHGIDAQTPLATVERRVFSALLWQVRVLAGWLPAEGVEMIRSCVAWFEIRNVEDRIAHLAGMPARVPFELGRLGVISRALPSTDSRADIRRLLAGSSWGDPGADDAYSIRMWMLHRWHRRARDAAPELRVWGDAAVWLLAVRERLADRPGADLVRSDPPRFPPSWRWVTATPWTSGNLWTAEDRWWAQVEEEGARLFHSPITSRKPVIGAIATLAASARDLAVALEIVSGWSSVEGFDATG
ncbi:MAG: hypothetical protein WCB51_00015 [Candidatus Dormiibacterota bacterium]